MTNVILTNDFVTDKKIKEMSSKTFSVLTYLWLMEKRNTCTTTIRTIKEFFKIEKDTIVFHLDKLEKLNYITIDVDINNCFINKVINITIKDIEANKGYDIIPGDIFFDYYNIISHHGWSLLCVLVLLYNKNYGYAFPSRDQLCDILGISPSTISKATEILVKNELIKIKNKGSNIVVYNNKIYSKNYQYLINNKVIDHKKNKINNKVNNKEN